MTKRIPHPVARAELARRAARGRSTVTEACDGPLKAACLPRGRIDATHPATVAWARAREIDPAALLVPSVRQKPDDAPAMPARAGVAGVDVTPFLDLTLRQIQDRFGSEQGFSDWLADRKTVEEIVRLEIANRTTRGTLISRELVQSHVFGAWDGLQKRLLTDSPRTLAKKIANMARAGSGLEELEAVIREHMSSMLHPVKTEAARALRGGRPEAQAKEP